MNEGGSRSGHWRAGMRAALGALVLVLGIVMTATTSDARSGASCSQGKSYAGFAIQALSPKFDGLQATITPLGGYTGLVGSEHVIGAIALGYPQPRRAYLLGSVGGYVGDRGSRFSYEWWANGQFHFRNAFELGDLRAGRPYTVKLEHLAGSSWRVSMNGSAPKEGLFRLADSSNGLPFPRVYVQTENEAPPCATGSFRFDHVLLRDHGSNRWHPFPRSARLFRSPGLTISLSSITSFQAGTAP